MDRGCTEDRCRWCADPPVACRRVADDFGAVLWLLLCERHLALLDGHCAAGSNAPSQDRLRGAVKPPVPA